MQNSVTVNALLLSNWERMPTGDDQAEFSSLGKGWSAIANAPKEAYPFGIPGQDYHVETWRPKNESGQVLFSSFEAVRNYEDVRSIFRVSGSGGFGSGTLSVNASASFEKRLTTTNLTVTAYVSLQVFNLNLRMSYRKFKQPALDSLKRGVDKFSDKYGDSYIYEQMMGGQLLGIFEYNAATREEYEAVSATISGSYGSASGRADFSKQTTVLRQFSRGKITLYRAGDDSPINVNPLDPVAGLSQFLAIASNFEKAVSYDGGKPVSLGWNVIDYQGIDNRPDRTSLDIRKALLAKNVIVDLHDQQSLAQGNFRTALDSPDRFNQERSVSQQGYDHSTHNISLLDKALIDLSNREFQQPLPQPPSLQTLPPIPQLKVDPHPRIRYSAVPNSPWGGARIECSNGEMLNGDRAGNSGSLRDFELHFAPSKAPALFLRYLCNISGVGDVTEDDGRINYGNVEAIQIWLDGPAASLYDLNVTAYVDYQGWRTGKSGTRFGQPEGGNCSLPFVG